ncbi:MAG: hypothetical protein H3C34_18730, partial [Caldilineaceae bacterium]|nr:hypothetical protein [Caldilineaceae bacterium]
MMLETRPSRFDKIAVVLIALAAAALLITAGGWTLGLRSWWAFSFLVYVPVGLRWLAAALVVVAALPPLYGWWAPLGKLWCPPWLAVLIALPLFWFLREHTWHGDALYKVALLSTETLQSDPYVWKEPLDSFFEHLLAAAVRPIGLQPDSAVALMSVVAGGLYVAAVWVVSAWLAEQGARRFVYRVGLLATGASLLWFGHVENYSWSTALAFTTVVLGAGVLQGQAPLWLAGLVAGVAVSFHPQSAFVAPALLLLVRGRQWPRQLLALVAAGSVVPVATVLLFWALGIPSPLLAGQGFAGDSQLFWTPAQALAPGQVAQALQNLWLIAPLWPMAI